MHFSQYLSSKIIKKILSSYLEIYFNGYGTDMIMFTKTSKVPLGHLRSQGHNSVAYVDDSYLQGDAYQSCLASILDTIKLLKELGSLPTQINQFLLQVGQLLYHQST